MTTKKFFFITEFAEVLDLAIYLQNHGHKVVMHVTSHADKKSGDGIIKKDKEWYRYLGKGYIWVLDGCNDGDLQEWLREQGEAVIGGSKAGDEMENNRQTNQKWFKELGFFQPFSKNFTSIDDVIEFVNNYKDKRWILKQNGDAPKSLNHMGKFDDNVDMLFHLEELKKAWNESQFGPVDLDLMEVVEGMEVAASAFFNGHDFLRDKDGKIVGFLNFEEKKESNGNMGETTGETGTTFYGCNTDNELFDTIINKEGIIKKLQEMNFRGVFDINGSMTEKGYCAFEPTMRFGIPATSYEFMEGMYDTSDVIEAIAKGWDKPVKIHEGVGMVIVVAAKPYPLEADMDASETSQGERLWILKNGKPIDKFSSDQKEHIHLCNFFYDEEEKCYKVAGKGGYLLTVTGKDGDTIEKVRENLIKYIKDNIYLAGMKIRTDIGERMQEYE